MVSESNTKTKPPPDVRDCGKPRTPAPLHTPRCEQVGAPLRKSLKAGARSRNQAGHPLALGSTHMHALYEFCQWLNNSNIGTSIRESTLVFPIVEGTHLLAIGVSAGTIAITDLRLLGWIMKKDPATRVMSSLLPFTIGGFIVVFLSGSLLFWAEAEKSYRNPWFRFKLLFLLLAGLNALFFHTGIYRRMRDWDNEDPPPAKARFAGASSLVLWALVIWLGRQFAYSS
jgi:hypothetical protein